MDRTETEWLIALLHAQRGEAARRSMLVRNTPAWAESCARLGDLNDQIMHAGARGSPIGRGGGRTVPPDGCEGRAG